MSILLIGCTGTTQNIPQKCGYVNGPLDPPEGFEEDGCKGCVPPSAFVSCIKLFPIEKGYTQPECARWKWHYPKEVTGSSRYICVPLSQQ